MVRETTREGVRWLELARPEALNALDRAGLRALEEALRRAAADPDCRVLVVTGEGDRAFAAGADLREMCSLPLEEVRGMIELGQRVTALLEELDVPTLAAVRGFALGGGCELALACDGIAAGESARFGLPEVTLAVLPGWGGTQRLERRVGFGRARDLLFSGRQVAAPEALAIGLCDWVEPDELLQERVQARAAELARRDRASLAAIKHCLRARATMPPVAALREEVEWFVRLFDREERRAAMERFRR